MSEIDQDIIKIFVEKRNEDNQEILKQVEKARKEAKDAIGSIDYLLLSQLVNQLR